MKMKKIKYKIIICLSVIFICFLISASSLSTLNAQMPVNEELNHFSTNSFNRFIWKWNTTEVVSTESTMNSRSPAQTVDSVGNIHLAWEDVTEYASSGSDKDIFYKRWESSSKTWITTEVISTESDQASLYSSLTVDTAGNVHVVWNDWSSYGGSGSDYDIFYKRWDINSLGWTITEVVSKDSTGSSNEPFLRTDKVGNIHVCWHDQTNYAEAGTDWDIFYKVFIGPPLAPKLAFIVPNPSEINTVNLNWNDVIGATSYYIYRSMSYIWSLKDISSITEVTSSSYIDTLPSEGIYYYVVVASNFVGKSTHSNCQYIEFELPHVQEFVIISSLILGTFVISLVILRNSRKKSKMK